MNKLPSEKITEIFLELCKERQQDPYSAGAIPMFNLAITRYLDEIHLAEEAARSKLKQDLVDL